MFSALIAAFANSFGVISNKLILNEKGISWKKYLTISFFFTSFFTSILFPFFGKISPEFFTFRYLFVFAGIVVLAFLYNLAFCFALSKSMVCDVEPLVLLVQPLSVLFAVLIFPSERSIYPFIFTLIATTALVLSRISRRHFKMNKITVIMLVYVFFVAIEAQLAKVILPVISPIALYTIRCFIISVLLLFVLKPKLRRLNKLQLFQIGVNSLSTTIENIARLYAVLYIGIVNSSLILLIAPVLILVYSKVFMKERLTLKKAIADAIIILCIIGSYLIK